MRRLHKLSRTRLPTLVAACAALACSPAWAGAIVSGTVASRDGGSFVGGLGDFLLPGDELWVGLNSPGQLLLDGGSLLRVGTLSLAQNGGRTVPADGVSGMLITGIGTRVQLDGDGNRLGVGEWGAARLTISDGATVDGRFNSAACLTGRQWCSVFIGNAAGSDGTLTITGAGSNASFLRSFVVGGVAVFKPPIESFTFGTPGGVTRGRVEVLDGGSLTTDGASLGVAPGGSSPLGSERSFAEVVIDGPGSVWRVTGGSLDGSGAAVRTALHRNASATITVSGGGRLWIDGKRGVSNDLLLSGGGGRTDMLVAGSGSAVLFTGDAGGLNVGRGSYGTATLALRDGGSAVGMLYMGVGRDGAYGRLDIEGAGSALRVNGTASAAASGGVAFNPLMDIGRNGGTGVVSVTGGGTLEIAAELALQVGPQLSVGREANSSGTLLISGTGSTARVSARSSGSAGSAEAVNPLVRVGREGAGFLNITGGGQLLIDGQALSTPTDSRSTSLFIGGSSDTAPGGRGIALVSGLGSEIRLTGNDTYIGVGHGPQSFGQLTIADQASVSAIGMNVGRSGGVGVLSVNNATLNFSGQQTGGTLSGAFLSIGRSGGVGVATIDNGSQVTIHNLGSLGATLNLGGSGSGPLGDGTLTLSGGSRISIEAAAGKASMTVARDGTGLMRIKGGSSVEVLGGGVFVGRLTGSDGTLLMSEGSSLTTSWLGVARDKTSTGSVDGGTGTLVVNNSTLTADTIVIGTNGFLGGSGTIRGNVINYGIFSPGNSPGQMHIDGGFSAAAGSRLVLEVESDGLGGFSTDSLLFGEGSALDLAHLAVEFRFLGSTDPNAFQAGGGFSIDTFFQMADGAGGSHGLDPASFAGATFTAQADAYQFNSFSFSAAGGAVFSAQPVPEPGMGWMALAGSGFLALVLRRRAQSREPVARAR